MGVGIRKPEFTKIHFSIKVIFSNLSKLTVKKKKNNTAFVPCGFGSLGLTIPGLKNRMLVGMDF